MKATGKMERVLRSRGYGFLRDADGHERFVCAADFVNPDEWETVKSGDRVTFIPRRRPNGGRNGLGCAEARVER